MILLFLSVVYYDMCLTLTYYTVTHVVDPLSHSIQGLTKNQRQVHAHQLLHSKIMTSTQTLHLIGHQKKIARLKSVSSFVYACCGTARNLGPWGRAFEEIKWSDYVRMCVVNCETSSLGVYPDCTVCKNGFVTLNNGREVLHDKIFGNYKEEISRFSVWFVRRQRKIKI